MLLAYHAVKDITAKMDSRKLSRASDSRKLSRASDSSRKRSLRPSISVNTCILNHAI